MVQNIPMYKAKLIDGKLMLTSSDIQVGDKFSHKIWGQTFVCTDRKFSLVWEEHRKFSENDCFKVIGEILTSGIIENQEFTKKEIDLRERI